MEILILWFLVKREEEKRDKKRETRGIVQDKKREKMSHRISI